MILHFITSSHNITEWLANTMEQRLPWEANSSPTSQGIPWLLQNSNLLLCSQQQATYPLSSQINPLHVPAVTWFIHQTHSIKTEKYGVINLFLTQVFFVISLNVLLNFTPCRFMQQLQLFWDTGCVLFIIALTKEALLQKILHVLGHTVDSCCAQVHNKMYINARVYTRSHTVQKDVFTVA
jgi:hypothetical protein